MMSPALLDIRAHLVEPRGIDIAIGRIGQRQSRKLIAGRWSWRGRRSRGPRYFSRHRDIRHFQKRKQAFSFRIPERFEQKKVAEVLIMVGCRISFWIVALQEFGGRENGLAQEHAVGDLDHLINQITQGREVPEIGYR